MRTHNQELNVNFCVKCGYCCTIRPCRYGEWDDKKKQCKFLTEDNLCEKYKEIISLAKDQWKWNPAFGEGCSSTLFNTRREEKIKSILKEYE